MDRLWARYRSRIPGLIALRPHVADGLVRLRAAGWRLGVVTNGQPDNQLAKLRRTGLADLVDGGCVSGEVGVRKPDPAIFRSAARRCLGSAQDGPVEPGRVVGDSPGLDVDGCRRAGLRTFWISHYRPWPAGRTPPDRVAADTHLAIRALLEDR